MSGLSSEARVDLQALCEQRAATYGLLSRLYRVEVDAELLAALRTMAFPLGSGSAEVDEGYRRIATYLSKNGDGARLDLAVDYVRTFLGHSNSGVSAAYPYESVYTSEKRLLMQEARDDVMALYGLAGMVIENWVDPEDHIALELEYMQIMAMRTGEALEKGDDDAALEYMGAQKSFMLDHLAAWAPMLTKDMKDFAKTDFYQGLAYLTEGFLRMDRAFLKTVVEG